MAEVVTGLRRPASGRVFIGGDDVTGLSPGEIIHRGVACIPEDRTGTGLVPGLGALDNLILKEYKKEGISSRGFINYPAAQKKAARLLQKFEINVPGLAAPVRVLSGGNLQRLLLTREISARPKLIVAVYPVRGLDIAATEAVHRILLEQRAEGCAILLISDDLKEIFKLSDRIAVLHRGEVKAVLEAGDADLEEVGLFMLGSGKGGVKVS
ncbi:MAG: ATP-binding cassette domain-containing protein [Peptococcaceae bacterium]|nr:ATP-binding cassette domain-containing protein [Peptococcaceae bacterium]